MAKTPRLKFFGIECSLKEVKILVDAAGYNTRLSAVQGFGAPRMLKEGDPLHSRAFGEVIGSLQQKGLIVFSRNMNMNVWTELGRRYVQKVAAKNHHIRFENTWRFEKRENKRRKNEIPR